MAQRPFVIGLSIISFGGMTILILQTAYETPELPEEAYLNVCPCLTHAGIMTRTGPSPEFHSIEDGMEVLASLKKDKLVNFTEAKKLAKQIPEINFITG